MISVLQLTELQDAAVRHWHQAPIENNEIDFCNLVMANHEINFRLWHEEDQARDPNASDTCIAAVKRAIDRLNQQRADSIERIDEAIESILLSQSVAPQTARMNTETPGSAIDRLSILSLRIYHLAEESQRIGIAPETKARIALSLRIAKQQQANLQESLQQLLDDLSRGLKRHQTFRQLKMYNDPELNPVLQRQRDQRAK